MGMTNLKQCLVPGRTPAQALQVMDTHGMCGPLAGGYQHSVSVSRDGFTLADNHGDRHALQISSYMRMRRKDTKRSALPMRGTAHQRKQRPIRGNKAIGKQTRIRS